MSVAENDGVLDAGAVDPLMFRQVMGSFASGVVVVTAEAESGPVGITCQSFASLSLDPALVLFCPSSSSWAWGEIRRAGRFCVNVLAEEQDELALVFASRSCDKFAGIPFETAPSGAPVLTGAAAWIDCDLHMVHPGGDHDVAVGAVAAMGRDAGRRPLLYHQGTFGALAGR